MLHHTPDPAYPPNLSLRRASLFRRTAACTGAHTHVHTQDDNDAVSLGGGRCERSAQITSLCCREQGGSYCSALTSSHVPVTPLDQNVNDASQN